MYVIECINMNTFLQFQLDISKVAALCDISFFCIRVNDTIAVVLIINMYIFQTSHNTPKGTVGFRSSNCI